MPRYRKRFYGITLVMSLLALTLQGAVTHAQTMFQGYKIGVQVFNVMSSTANVTLTAYNPDGSMDSQFSDTIAGNSSKTYFPLTSGNNNFAGSLVAASSGGNIVSIANIAGPGFIASASFIGQNIGDTTLRLPLLMKNNGGFYTWFSIQNAGNSDANVTVHYSDGSADRTATIKKGAAKNFFSTVRPTIKRFSLARSRVLIMFPLLPRPSKKARA